MDKILFINKGDGIDYQCDCLFHGLCNLENVYVETICDYWYMYEGNSSEDLYKLYGKGFSISNRVQRNKQHTISDTDALKKIQSHYYDFIIYGSIHRDNRFLDVVLNTYKKNEIALIDGEDFPFTKKRNPKSLFLLSYNYRTKRKCFELAKKAIYFKRELEKDYANYVYPISFAIPEENIVKEIPQDKIREQAIVYPGDLKTYIYKTEVDYYNGYKEAKYGVTFKKAGWDCLRHYEILANGCIPYFPDIDELPDTTMIFFPRNIIKETNRLRDNKLMSEELYNYYLKYLLDYTKEYLTTKQLAKYVLSVMKKEEQK